MNWVVDAIESYRREAVADESAHGSRVSAASLLAARAALGLSRRDYCARLAACADERYKPLPQHLYAWETGRRPVPVWVALAAKIISQGDAR